MIIERNESSGSIEITIHDNIIIPGFTLKVLAALHIVGAHGLRACIFAC